VCRRARRARYLVPSDVRSQKSVIYGIIISIKRVREPSKYYHSYYYPIIVKKRRKILLDTSFRPAEKNRARASGFKWNGRRKVGGRMRYANFKLAHYQMRAATWLMAAGIFSLVCEIDARGASNWH
jgi:hypothetical protein